MVSGKRFLDCSDDEIRRTMAVNTMAHFWTVKAFLPEMIARDSGHVVTVASAAGTIGVSRLADYCASKFAAVGFDESLRVELGQIAPGVVTTVICPFFITTGMFDGVRTRVPWLLPILDEVGCGPTHDIRHPPAPKTPDDALDRLSGTGIAVAADASLRWSGQYIGREPFNG